jgi:hypothetical protein
MDEHWGAVHAVAPVRPLPSVPASGDVGVAPALSGCPRTQGIGGALHRHELTGLHTS